MNAFTVTNGSKTVAVTVWAKSASDAARIVWSELKIADNRSKLIPAQLNGHACKFIQK